MSFFCGVALGLAIPMFWPKLFSVINEKVLEMIQCKKTDNK